MGHTIGMSCFMPSCHTLVMLFRWSFLSLYCYVPMSLLLAKYIHIPLLFSKYMHFMKIILFWLIGVTSLHPESWDEPDEGGVAGARAPSSQTAGDNWGFHCWITQSYVCLLYGSGDNSETQVSCSSKYKVFVNVCWPVVSNITVTYRNMWFIYAHIVQFMSACDFKVKYKLSLHECTF